MKTYNIIRIYLFKLFILNLISFILTFTICVFLIRVLNKYSEINLVNLLILLMGIFLAFIVYPWSIKKCSENIEVRIAKDKISIIGESFKIDEVEKISLNYKFLLFPQLKLNLKDKKVENLIIQKYRKDYFDLEYMLK
jgi:hypothetical protein